MFSCISKVILFKNKNSFWQYSFLARLFEEYESYYSHLCVGVATLVEVLYARLFLKKHISMAQCNTMQTLYFFKVGFIINFEQWSNSPSSLKSSWLYSKYLTRYLNFKKICLSQIILFLSAKLPLRNHVLENGTVLEQFLNINNSSRTVTYACSRTFVLDIILE